MIRGVLVLSIVLATAPACSQNRPVANLKFVEASNGVNHIKFRYQSDTDFDSLVDPTGKRKVVTRRLRCALEEDQDFSVEHVIERYGDGQVIKEGVFGQAAIDYMTPVYFFETFNKDTTRKYISGEDLKMFLGRREKIPCKVVMTIYLSRPYYSATMWIPSYEILKALPHDFPMPVGH
jgi:hypothetical protein